MTPITPMLRPPFISLILALAPLPFCSAASPAFVPLPEKVVITEGRFKLDATTSIIAPAELANEANHLATRLRKTAGLPATIASSGNGISLAIQPAWPEEAYTLEITSSGVVIRGGSTAGVFYGVQTFLQALPPAVLGNEAAPMADWSAPALRIEDVPTTAWRGLHLDSSRHFQPKEFILKFLNAMAAQKLNRLHWHLVDSEGWRLEIKKYPKLTEVTKDFPAYYPEEIPTNPTVSAKFRYGTFHGGGFYSQDDVRQIVAHAKNLHITVIPEIEFPGHAMAALTAYPEFGTTGKVPHVKSNISPDLIGVHPEAIGFIKDILDETLSLFPSKWIHFGGDEAPKGQWKNDPYTQKKIDELGLRVNDPKKPHASEEALQAWFFNEMADHIAKQGRLPVGWEEIMHGDNLAHLTQGAVIMPWLDVNQGVRSANAGFGVVHTHVGTFYLDSYQVKEKGEPVALYQGPMTLEKIHRFELFPAGLTAEGRKKILGAQGQLWTELMPRTDDVEYQAFPRACAIAELTWTSPERRADTEGFMARLAEHGARLSALGLNHRRVPPPATMAWSPNFLAAGTDWTVPLPADQQLAIASGTPLSVTFVYRAGAHGIDISAVELLADGEPVAEDRHPGFSGGQPKNHDYKLSLPRGTKFEKLSLRVSAKGAGGTDSHGEIRLSSGP